MSGADTTVYTSSCRQPPANEAPPLSFMGFDCVLMAGEQNCTFSHQEIYSDENWQASCISDIMVILLSLSASNVKGNTKRAIVNTLFFVGYCASNIGAPQLWTTDAAPRYFDGVILNISAWCTTILAISVYWGLCYFDNRRRDQGHVAYPGRVYQAGEDLTDKEDNLFRYSY